MFRNAILILFITFLFLPVVFVFATQLTTTMTWFVPANKTFTIAYGGSCSTTAFFFPEDQAVLDNDNDGNAAQILPYNVRSGGTACQSSSFAPVLITNACNTTITVDGNFSGNIDTNLWLKAWQGTGAGCGTSGLGGWQLRCGLTGTQDLNTSHCKDFNSSNDLVAARLVTSLPLGDTNQLCFTGDFLTEVAGGLTTITQGDHNGTFQYSSDVS